MLKVRVSSRTLYGPVAQGIGEGFSPKVLICDREFRRGGSKKKSLSVWGVLP